MKFSEGIQICTEWQAFTILLCSSSIASLPFAMKIQLQLQWQCTLPDNSLIFLLELGRIRAILDILNTAFSNGCHTVFVFYLSIFSQSLSGLILSAIVVTQLTCTRTFQGEPILGESKQDMTGPIQAQI